MKAKITGVGVDGNVEVWLGDSPYSPILHLRRARRPRTSVTVHDGELQPLYDRLLGEDEQLFVEEVLFEYLASSDRSLEQKLRTVQQLQQRLKHAEEMVRERIEFELAEKREEGL